MSYQQILTVLIEYMNHHILTIGGVCEYVMETEAICTPSVHPHYNHMIIVKS